MTEEGSEASDNDIAKAVLDTFDSLPAKRKPVKPTEDFFQWVPISGIVVSKGLHQKTQTRISYP